MPPKSTRRCDRPGIPLGYHETIPSSTASKSTTASPSTNSRLPTTTTPSTPINSSTTVPIIHTTTTIVPITTLFAPIALHHHSSHSQLSTPVSASSVFCGATPTQEPPLSPVVETQGAGPSTSIADHTPAIEVEWVGSVRYSTTRPVPGQTIPPKPKTRGD